MKGRLQQYAGFPVVFFLFLACGAGAPFAQEQEGQVVIRAEDCRYLTLHAPQDDVHYRPEQDAARGIAPADLPSPGGDLLRREFDYLSRNFDFAVWTDVREPRGPGRRAMGADGVVAYVEVRDGLPYLNGLPLTGDDLNAAARACAESGDQKDR